MGTRFLGAGDMKQIIYDEIMKDTGKAILIRDGDTCAGGIITVS